MERLEVQVPPDAAGERLDRFLVNVLGGQSRSQIQRLVREGRITVAGHQARPTRR